MKSEDRRLRHQDAWELLPWYVNGTLDSGERSAVEAHLERCGLCRSELAASRQLASAVRRAVEVPASGEERLEQLLGRLDEAPPPSAATRFAPLPAAAARGAASRLPAAVRWALALQAAAILALALGLGYLLARPDAAVAAAPAEPAFRTLAAPPLDPAPGLAVRAVFNPTASERELRHLLLAAGARLAAGPSPAGVYTLEIAGDEEAAEAALERLRHHPLVELAEPVVVTPPRGAGR